MIISIERKITANISHEIIIDDFKSLTSNIEKYFKFLRYVI